MLLGSVGAATGVIESAAAGFLAACDCEAAFTVVITGAPGAEGEAGPVIDMDFTCGATAAGAADEVVPAGAAGARDATGADGATDAGLAEAAGDGFDRVAGDGFGAVGAAGAVWFP
jgi:hypothetical protein